jgi:hypothetical protein
MNRPTRTIVTVAGAAGLAFALTACGGGSSSGSGATGGTGSGTGSAATPGPASTTPDCGSTPVQDAVHDSHITKVQVIGGCTQVSVETSLTRADVATATTICEDAVKVAYVGNVSSVTVTGADKHELAAGEKGMDGCIGEP